MSQDFKIEIVNPEKAFFSKENVSEVVVPALEGEMGILKDHISIISFLKPGIIKIFSQEGENKYYIEDGIMEFKNNILTILTGHIFSLNKLDKSFVEKSISEAEKSLLEDIDDQKRFLISQKIDVLKSLTLN